MLGAFDGMPATSRVGKDTGSGAESAVLATSSTDETLLLKERYDVGNTLGSFVITVGSFVIKISAVRQSTSMSLDPQNHCQQLPSSP